MAAEGTRRIVPRQDLEGSLGSGEKRWEKAYVGNVGNVYDTVADMVADLELMVDSTVITKGYYTVNDGGNGIYNIREKTVSDVDGGAIVFLTNGNVAELIVSGTMNIKQFGAVGDGVTNDTAAFRSAFLVPKLYIPEGNYKITDYIIGLNEVVCDGTFTDYTPLFSRPNMLETIDRFVPVGNGQYNFGYLGTAYVEAMAYNPNTNKIVLALYKFSPNERAVFLTINKDTLAIEDTVEVNAAIGINTLSYDAVNNVYYARNRYGSQNNKFYSFNADDLSDYTIIADASVLGEDLPYYTWVADNDTRMIYEIIYDDVRKSLDVDIYDSSHTNKLKSVQFPDNICSQYWVQDACSYNGKVYIFTETHMLELDLCSGTANRIASDGGNEMEGCTFVDGTLWITHHQPGANGLELLSKYESNDFAQNFEKIKESSISDTLDIDLNYYLVDGKFLCNSSDTTGKHYPSNETKGIIVNHSSSRLSHPNTLNYVTQTFHSLTAPYHTYERTYYMDTRTWSDWACYDKINSQGSGYVRYENGLQICFMKFEVSMSGASSSDIGITNYQYRKSFTVNYPVPFTTIITAVANAIDSVNYWLASINNESATSASGFIMGNNNSLTKKIGVFAIGYWK